MASASAASIEITVVSAQGLRNSCSFPFFWKRLRSYATVALSMAGPCRNELPDESRPAYATKVDDRGGTDPRWDEKFRIPVDSVFLEDVRFSSICVRVYARGGSQLGWCRVPMEDVVISPPGKVSYLSYRLRDPRDGTRGHGIVSVAVKLDGLQANTCCSRLPSLDSRQAVIGIPVSIPVFPVNFDRQCHRYNAIR
ncbi:hypothetical protein MLD38_016537 [Melastoma candidum]|uniref:Uncharacterized protein n=1 Tax=Melastoma candidum TaxID=119954 RepID=A0ACB9QQU3_9MYRT|nr:hypothetical protein MLD38_016537 [Melastoma candidum]